MTTLNLTAIHNLVNPEASTTETVTEVLFETETHSVAFSHISDWDETIYALIETDADEAQVEITSVQQVVALIADPAAAMV